MLSAAALALQALARKQRTSRLVTVLRMSFSRLVQAKAAAATHPPLDKDTGHMATAVAAHCRTAAAATTSAGVRSPKVMHRRGTDGRACSNARENDQIKPLNTAWAAS